MAIYESFSEIYDVFMEDVPYDRWCVNLRQIFAQYGIENGLLLELGCGTGNMTERMAAAGFDMTGVDRSSDMLEIAMAKQYQRLQESAQPEHSPANPILYLCQDMRAFELYGTMAGIYAVCDSMNYLLEKKDLLKVLRLANNYLDPAGIFVFDMVSKSYYRQIGEETIVDSKEIGAFIWQNSFSEEEGINRYDMEMFIRDPEGESYHRQREMHLTRAYDPQEIIDLIEEAGLAFRQLLDADTMQEVTEDTERYYFVTQEIQKRDPSQKLCKDGDSPQRNERQAALDQRFKRK